MTNDNRPVFMYQSQLTNNDRAFATENVQVTKQADQSNTLGSVPVEMARFQVQQIPGFGVAQAMGNTIMGGTPTFKDILNDPAFVCSVVDLAAELENPQVGGLPACGGGKTLIAKQPGFPTGDSWAVQCGCASDGPRDPKVSESQIAAIVDAADKCMKQKRQGVFDSRHGDRVPSNIFKSWMDESTPWAAYGEIYNKMYLNILSMDLEPSEKSALIRDLANQLNGILISNGWDSHPSYDEYIENLDLFVGVIEGIVKTIAEDSSLNTTPSPNSIAMVLQGMSQKPEKTCGSYKDHSYDNTSRSGTELSENCNCLCKDEQAQLCPDTNHCIECLNGTVMVAHPAVYRDPAFAPYGAVLRKAYCTCQCPEGTEFKLGQCVPKCEAGFTSVETDCPENATSGQKCYKCACVVNVGSWLFPKFETKEDDCTYPLVRDSNNRCECTCPEGFDTYYDPNYNPEDPDTHGTRCRKCPEGQYYKWDEDTLGGRFNSGCKCNPSSYTRYCPSHAEISEANNCNCACVAPFISRSVDDSVWGFECVCPPGTMLNNSESACIPVSSGWGETYTSLTPVELERMIKSYKIDDNIKLL